MYHTSSAAQLEPESSLAGHQYSHPSVSRSRSELGDGYASSSSSGNIQSNASSSQIRTRTQRSDTLRPDSSRTAPMDQDPRSESPSPESHVSQQSSIFDTHSPQQASSSSQDTTSTSQRLSQSASQRSNRPEDIQLGDARPRATFSDAANPSGKAAQEGAAPVPHMDLATFPSTELLRILAMLLQQIATANDDIRPRGTDTNLQAQPSPHSRDPSAAPRGDRGHESGTPTPGQSHSRLQRTDSGTAISGSGNRSRSGSMRAGQEGLHGGEPSRLRVTTAAQAALMTPSSTLCFHARNVPTINIESYLLRILKYCPTTNEVFLSLLVYFDRMSRMGAGAGPGEDNRGAPAGQAAGLPQSRTREISASFGEQHERNGSSTGAADQSSTAREPRPGMRGFAIDSFNVHRLIIAGLTVSSKFFSDVFYTNSRYAKVGGLPVHELNQLELQFLLLNDFHLVIPLEEIQRYADQLLIYGRGQQQTRQIPRPIKNAPTTSSAQDRYTSNSAQSSGAPPQPTAV
ncbi:cyclin-like protein interacting with PHO85 [Tilletia horrida]|uniref:Cyclin-like protein interacting with PHO85 n=1 Tax=Tilletia horrida TaxID=155126 RepID=A0AAN6GRZ6_9BASI|nr:cyclin-like protein interacting with PHO85 [Tilletia horrida]KAK0553729.1 cyclin-like protein interacting with PHO85 [Tilletia horrida]KAK0567645.1 cyclin-like protein interacting with PHO85 [Tilletia horrida]